MLATPAFAVELFRYRGAAKDGGTLEYVFEAGEQNSPNAITKEKVAKIAADFMTTFYHEQVGALAHWKPGNFVQRRFRSARFLFGRDQRAAAANVPCCTAGGWDGC
jgi:hypothetical protein